MNPLPTLRVRRSLVELQDEYKQGNTKPLLDLMRAWQGIKDLKYEDLRSFFALAGYHGEPFRGPGQYSSNFWGGFCNHGNVLFPTWHRVYCLKVEEALQSIPGCEEVTLPYWDQTATYLEEATGEWVVQGVPWALTVPSIKTEDGQDMPNPLLSFRFPIEVLDEVPSDKNEFTRPQGYETVRYPLSGLVGDEAMRQASEVHNQQYPDYTTNVQLLDQNVVAWLTNTLELPGQPGKPGQPDQPPTKRPIGVAHEFERCLDAPNYTVFSNTTSAQQWNETYDPSSDPQHLVVPLESPHNHIHLAVGGFDVPGQGDFSPIAGANGDMGENDTAAMDPLFFFHHCNIDRVFWLWQKKHNRTDYLDIIKNYPGTNSNDNQFPTPGYAPNTALDVDSPLNPFQKYTGEVYTSNDCLNIETQLGYTYSKGSLEAEELLAARSLLAAVPPATKVLRVTNINRAPIKGSFIVAVYHHTGDTKELVGYHSVLSRWDPVSCSNCKTHLEVKAFFPLHAALADSATEDDFRVHLIHRRQDTPYLDRFAAANLAPDPQPAENLHVNRMATATTVADNLLTKRLETSKPYRLTIK
jgi:tyrosinase